MDKDLKIQMSARVRQSMKNVLANYTDDFIQFILDDEFISDPIKIQEFIDQWVDHNIEPVSIEDATKDELKKIIEENT
jgi:hypothetical protein